MGVAKESDTTERLSKQIRMSDIPDIYPKTSTPVKSSHFSILHPYSILPVNSLFGGPQTACSQVKVTHQWDKVTYTCPGPHMFAMALPFLSKSFIPKTPAGLQEYRERPMRPKPGISGVWVQGHHSTPTPGWCDSHTTWVTEAG